MSYWYDGIEYEYEPHTVTVTCATEDCPEGTRPVTVEITDPSAMIFCLTCGHRITA